jgi:signal transduction histidine kinase
MGIQQNRTWLTFFRKWIEPHSSITNPVDRQHYQFILSLFLSSQIALVGLLVIYWVSGITNSQLVISAWILLITNIPCYLLTRTAYYHYPPYIAITVLHGVFWYVLFTTSFDSALGLLFSATFILALTNLFLGTFPTLISTFTNLLATYFFGQQYGFALETTVLIAFSLININIGLIIRDYYARQIEILRRSELEKAFEQSEEARKTTERANQELQKAAHVISENARLRSEFMASMSHELRTPLNAIGGFCGIMLNDMGGNIDQEARHMVSRIEENGIRLLMLVNDILDLSRMEAGRIVLQNAPFNIRDLAKQWQYKMSAIALERGLDFDVIVSQEMPDTVIGDLERISQVIMHLLSNAFKFTAEGSINVNIRPLNQEQFQIDVRDTGIGISPENQAFIFDGFRQIDSSSTREYGGLGIGLAIVRNIVDVLQGHISVFSDPNIGGTTFTLTLPLQTQNTNFPAINQAVKE